VWALGPGVAMCLLSLVPAGLTAQAATLTDAVDTATVTVGDRVHLNITVEHAVGARVVWPDSLDLSPFEVQAAERTPPSTQGDRVRSGVVLTLAAFELGQLEVPDFEVVVEGPGDASQVLTTHRFGIEVVSVGTDEGGDIRDIRGPLWIPVGVVTVSLWMLGVLAAVALLLWVVRRMRRRGDDEPARAAVPARPPVEVALEALDAIEASPLLERGQVKEYHIRVSEVLRIYVEGRFRTPALEMTTREVVVALGRTDADEAFVTGLAACLDACDMVKFAKVRPDASASLAVLVAARDLVVGSAPPAETE